MSLLQDIDFGNEAGDDVSPEELASFFVEQADFRQFLSLDRKISIVTGKKGIGKSILLQWMHLKFPETDPDAILVKCRGADLTRHEFGLSSPLDSPNDFVKDWMVRISALVNRRLAQIIKIPYNDDRLTLIETAELSGFKQRNFFAALIARLSLKLEKFEVDYEPQTIKNEIETLKRVANRNIIILVDDLDATFQNSTKELQELSSFFSACRYLSNDVQGLYFRVTMRTDVWPIVRRYDEALDKADQYVVDLNWNIEDFRTLLFRRIDSQLQKLGQRFLIHRSQTDEEYHEYIISKIFVNKMEWGDHPRHTYRVIYTLSYARPRWAIQLCKLSQQVALKKHDSKIDKPHIDVVWGEYGYKRIADLVSEHKHQCAVVEELVSAFRESERRLTKDDLFTLINNRILNHLPVIIDGVKAASPKDVAQFLYRIGFILARIEEAENSYEHYAFDDLPDLLSNRTSNDFGALWEIHPCYRQALDITKINRYQRIARGFIRKERR
jgi:hypothetical protein